MTPENKREKNSQEEKSFFSVIVHSFFIIPFLIAVFCLLLFAAVNLLTQERKSVYDYLEDVKMGAHNKRWQGAFELSKVLSNPHLYPKDNQFSNELITAFEKSVTDDNRVRQYLALAMGRTGRVEFVEPLHRALKDEKEENLSAVIYALGMLQDKTVAKDLYEFMGHPDARVRSITAVALGNIGEPQSINILRKGLNDPQPNVQWGAAVSLATMGDESGKRILLQLMDRAYYQNFPEVDSHEQNDLILMALQAATNLNDNDLNQKIKELSQSDPNMKVRAKALEILK